MRLITWIYDRHKTFNQHTISEAQRQSIMKEVLEDHISPNELSRKYSIPAYAIRDWIKKAGHTLPKSYKRFDRQDTNYFILNSSHYIFRELWQTSSSKLHSLLGP